MTIKLPTGSAWPRVMACPASAVLPQRKYLDDGSTEGDARQGTIKHAYLADVSKIGREAALEKLTNPAHLKMCERISLDGLPVGEGYRAEVSYAYDVETMSAREIGERLDRNYGELKPTEIALTVDVVHANLAGTGEILDYKGPYDTTVTPAYRNMQLGLGALCVAIVEGLDSVKVALIYLEDSGEHTYDGPHTLDMFALLKIRSRVTETWQTIKQLAQDIEWGKEPQVVEGQHCRYCPSFDACPAKKRWLERCLESPGGLAKDILSMMTPEQVGEAYRRWKHVRRVLLDEVGDAFKEWAREHPIDVSEGIIYGPTGGSRETVDGEVAFHVMALKWGQEAAKECTEKKATKTSIEQTIRRAGGKAEDYKRTLDAIRDAGGMRVNDRPEIKEHRVRKGKGS